MRLSLPFTSSPGLFLSLCALALSQLASATVTPENSHLQDAEKLHHTHPVDTIHRVEQIANWVVVGSFALLAAFAFVCFLQVPRRTRACSDRAFYVLCLYFCTIRCILLLAMSSSSSFAACLNGSMELMQVVLSVPTVLFLVAHTFVLYTWHDLRNVLALLPRTRLSLGYSLLGAVFLIAWLSLSVAAFVHAASTGFRDCRNAMEPKVLLPAPPPKASDFGAQFRENRVVFADTLLDSVYYFIIGILYAVVGFALDRTLARMDALGHPAVVTKMFEIGDFGETANAVVYSPWIFYGVLEAIPTALMIIVLRAQVRALPAQQEEEVAPIVNPVTYHTAYRTTQLHVPPGSSPSYQYYSDIRQPGGSI